VQSISVTHFGTATVLLEIGGTRILTDPVFGEKGISDSVMRIPGTKYTKLTDSIVKYEDVLPLDYILLSHDQHIDNLDSEGRKLFNHVKKIITTKAAAKRIKHNTIGLTDFQSVELDLKNGQKLELIATPCRHGPPLSLPFVGPVIGFILKWKDQADGALYISGDTVLFNGINEIAQRYKISLALLHFGAAKMKISNCLHYTFTANEGLKAAEILNPKTIIPIHYEGWSHFSDSKKEVIDTFSKSLLEKKLLWLKMGVPQVVNI